MEKVTTVCILKKDIIFHLKNCERFHVKTVRFCQTLVKEVELAVTTNENILYKFKDSRFWSNEWYQTDSSDDGRIYIDGFAVFVS